MNSFLELARARYSVRNYLDTPVEEDKLNYILECGRVAPSAANNQPWQIVVVRDPHLLEQIAGSYSRPWFRQAPVVLVFCGDHKAAWKRADGKDHTDIDLAIIVDHITLAAAEQGLGTCWICNFDPAICREVMNIPPHLEPIALLTLGYPGKAPDDKTRHLIRKPMEQIVRFELF